jgi:SAM-dependent methyltransferase
MRLDIGCGSYCRGDVGMDTTFDNIPRTNFQAAVEAYVGEKHPNPLLIYADANMGLPFKDNSFDEVVCSHCLEHLVDPWATLWEIHRVLKPGGRLLLLLPNVLGHEWHDRDSGDAHLYSWSQWSIKNLLDLVFEEVEIKLASGLGHDEHIFATGIKGAKCPAWAITKRR